MHTTEIPKDNYLQYCLSWKVKQTKLFIYLATLLEHQVLDNISLLLNQMFCFTGQEVYFVDVVKSLYREHSGNITTIACIKISAE